MLIESDAIGGCYPLPAAFPVRDRNINRPPGVQSATMPNRTSLTVILLIVGSLSCMVRAQEQDMFAGSVRLILPADFYAVPGVEMNVYFDNVLLTTNIANYAIDVQCPRGVQQVERWTWTPEPKDAGTYGFTITVLDEANEVVARAQSKLHVIPADAGANREVSILMIGDSLTNASVYPRRVWELCQAPGNPKLYMIGAWGPGGSIDGPVRYEGYGGWTAQRFMTHYTGIARGGGYRERGSSFIYADEGEDPKLDFGRYCQDLNGGNAPDFVTIFLGPNDIFGGTRDDAEEKIDVMLEYYTGLVDMIHTNGASTQIGVMLAVPPAGTQDAFGQNYNAGQTRWQYRNNQHRLVERMIELFGGREDDNIFIVPSVVNIDCMRNYPMATAAANAATEEQVTRLNNGVHPASSGYVQIGDTIYAWLKARLAD
jgi:lysophospholipase L1-like esterase